MRKSQTVYESKYLVLSGICLLVALAPSIAMATLGESEVSVQTDVEQARGAIKITERAGYRLHEIQLPSGSVVREFAGPDGVVFAVAWSGPAMPNLRQTLGRYFETYATAAQANRMGHHHLSLLHNDLVIDASGHMRSFTGRAYLPTSLPAGLSIGDLR